MARFGWFEANSPQDIQELGLARMRGRRIKPEMTITRELSIKIGFHRPQYHDNWLPVLGEMNLTFKVTVHLPKTASLDHSSFFGMIGGRGNLSTSSFLPRKLN